MNKKLMSLLLVLVLALSMVLVTVNALAAEEKVRVVATSGGRLNVWPQPVKKAGSSSVSLKNGTKIDTYGTKTYSTADKRWMVYITAGTVSGWVDAGYVGWKSVTPPAELKVVAEWETAKLMGTAPNSQINMWGSNEVPFTVRGKLNKIVLKSVPLGYEFKDVKVYNNGTAEVTFVTADLKEVTGYVRTKYLVNTTPIVPAPSTPK